MKSENNNYSKGGSGNAAMSGVRKQKNYRYKPQMKSGNSKSVSDKSLKSSKNPIKTQVKSQMKNVAKRAYKGNGNKLKIIPLGGLEQIGMNITAFEYGDSIVVVDCGLSFPEDDMLGIDLVIPDVTYLKENISKVKGFVITHGHEDHIGALP